MTCPSGDLCLCQVTCLCLSQVTSGLQSGVPSQVPLDILSLAELHRLGVPHTEDGLKYQYRLEKDRYGTSSRPQFHFYSFYFVFTARTHTALL